MLMLKECDCALGIKLCSRYRQDRLNEMALPRQAFAQGSLFLYYSEWVLNSFTLSTEARRLIDTAAQSMDSDKE